ncbi:hypothetical protein D3C80_1400890 [compost metagenome]
MQHTVILARLAIGQRDYLGGTHGAGIEIQGPVTGQVAAVEIPRTHFTGGAVAHAVQGAIERRSTESRGRLQHFVALTAIGTGLHQLVEAT